ncbi:MAG: SDR family NAD(P)-dependent oxidoreductase [Victivallales bacterium]|nr:SDR family NAD(P)-dependent oxidoreductase [Victivallales bacterium]
MYAAGVFPLCGHGVKDSSVKETKTTMSILDRFRLDGRKALVTGADRGIGRNFAEALAEAGADVAIIDIIAENAQRTAAEIAAATGRQTLAVTCDIMDAAQVAAAVDRVFEAFGRLDIAVNNAGISIQIKGIQDVTPAEWERQMGVNLNGTYNCLREEGRVMIPNGYGKIINIGSICGNIIWPHPQPQLPYSVSKAAVLHE